MMTTGRRPAAVRDAQGRPDRPDPREQPDRWQAWEVPVPWSRRATVLAVLLGAILTVVTVNAVYGGIGLIRDGMGMPADWAERLPFGSWTLGGLALLATVAAPQAMGLAAVATRHRYAALIGAVVGLALVAWIAVQLLILQRYFFLQPVIAGLGVIELALALALRRAASSGPPPPPPAPRTG